MMIFAVIIGDAALERRRDLRNSRWNPRIRHFSASRLIPCIRRRLDTFFSCFSSSAALEGRNDGSLDIIRATRLRVGAETSTLKEEIGSTLFSNTLAMVLKTVSAAKEKGVNTVTAGGGVVANGYLREALQKECAKNGLTLVLPEKRYCTDNAAMIAAEGLVQYGLGNFAQMSLNAKASIPLAATLQTVQSRRANSEG